MVCLYAFCDNNIPQTEQHSPQAQPAPSGECNYLASKDLFVRIGALYLFAKSALVQTH